MHGWSVSSCLRRPHPAVGRRQRFAVVAGIVVASLAIVTLLATATSDVPEEVRARRFVVLDQAGIVRAELRTEPDGSAVLRVSDGARGQRGGRPRGVPVQPMKLGAGLSPDACPPPAEGRDPGAGRLK